MQLDSCLPLASILRTGGRRYVASASSGCDSRFLQPFWGLVLAAGTENPLSQLTQRPYMMVIIYADGGLDSRYWIRLGRG